jgi:HEAT repeat protein
MFESERQKEKKKMVRVKEPSMETLINTLSNLKDKTREGARHTLVAMGKEAVPSLIEALKNRDTLMRWEAAKALGEIGDPETAPVLVKALEDEEFDVRWLAAEGLIKMNIKGLKPLLKALERRGDSVLLREGAHHVFHDLAKGELRKFLAPVLAALETLELGDDVPWATRYKSGMEVPLAARRALEVLEKLKQP